jgi:hypothetical protein
MNTLAKIVLLSAVTLSGQAMAGSVINDTNKAFASLEPAVSSQESIMDSHMTNYSQVSTVLFDILEPGANSTEAQLSDFSALKSSSADIALFVLEPTSGSAEALL